jgi:dethiobiotin synthetase
LRSGGEGGLTLSREMSAKTLFVTGTDTGVGKTILTGLLLTHLRREGHRALALKPFCTGGLEDVELLSELQDHELKPREMNPFYFSEPIAPLVAARNHGRVIRIEKALERIRAISKECDCLLIEGAGGLLTPLGERFSALQLIANLGGRVLCVAQNKLGAINHSVLTLQALQDVDVERIELILMGASRPDASGVGNAKILRELIRPIRVHEIPHFASLAKHPIKSRVCEKFDIISKKIKKTLAQFCS